MQRTQPLQRPQRRNGRSSYSGYSSYSSYSGYSSYSSYSGYSGYSGRACSRIDSLASVDALRSSNASVSARRTCVSRHVTSRNDMQQ